MIKIKYNYDISNISYIKVGGNVKVYIETDEVNVIQKILKITRKIKYIGNCSNIFFSFYYSDYIFIKYVNKSFIICKNMLIGSSLSLKFLSSNLIKKGISGFEKLEGIPGLIGGSIVNNASCYNQEISTLLIGINVLDEFGKEKYISKEEIIFSYHDSSLKNGNILILSAYFKIEYLNKEELIKEKEYVRTLRINSQPYDKITLGTTFKKIKDIVIPKVLEELNVKGMKKNLTCVSNKHSNFIEIGKKEKIENIIYLIEEVNRLLYNKLGYYIDLEIEKIRGKR